MEAVYNVKDGELLNANSLKIAQTAVKVLDFKKASDIKLLKIDEKTTIADYFVICAGSSSTQIKTLADEVEYELSQKAIEPAHIEGRATGWILLDYSSVLVHVFTGEAREYYNLERLWQDARTIDISDIVE